MFSSAPPSSAHLLFSSPWLTWAHARSCSHSLLFWHFLGRTEPRSFFLICIVTNPGMYLLLTSDSTVFSVTPVLLTWYVLSFGPFSGNPGGVCDIAAMSQKSQCFLQMLWVAIMWLADKMDCIKTSCATAPLRKWTGHQRMSLTGLPVFRFKTQCAQCNAMQCNPKLRASGLRRDRWFLCFWMKLLALSEWMKQGSGSRIVSASSGQLMFQLWTHEYVA